MASRQANLPAPRPSSAWRVGTPVWLTSGGDGACLGQLGQRLPGRGPARFAVHLLTGETVEAGEHELSEAALDAGASSSTGSLGFDVLLGPETRREALCDELITCLFEKGFCVLQAPQSAAEQEEALLAADRLAERGCLARLPEEVEEHYLASNFMARTAWIDPADADCGQDSVIGDRDDYISDLAALIQPGVEDFLGAVPVERTPALLARALDEEEAEDFPNPEADNEALGVFLGTWKRQLVKVFHLFGPASAMATLHPRLKADARYLPGLDVGEGPVDLLLEPGSYLLFDPRLFTLALERTREQEPLLLLAASLLRSGRELVLDGLEGDLSLLSTPTGPPPPPGSALVNVTSMATRMAASMDHAGATNAGLVGCTDCVTRIPYERFDIDIYYAEDQDNMQSWQTYSQHMAVVEGAQLFAAKHFEISTVEAKGMDPRQRHVLEIGAQALAGIGVTKQSTARQVRNAGVAVGTDGLEWPSYPKEDAGGLGNSSNALGITANRFSFIFNLRGPNFIVDTACSASLYAAHYIKLSLLQREWDPLEFCLAIGTQLFIGIAGFIGCAQAHMLSQNGRCFTFNATADGYQRGDGTNAFVMEHGAVRDDAYGLFRGSNANQDGRSASLTAPSGPAQEQCIWGALREAKMRPPESTVWECHGTGTSLGDPIEVGAVRKVQVKQAREEPLMIGSVKSNMGHLEGGAAMSAIMKCILQVSSAKCCPTSHFAVLNPHLEHAAFGSFYNTDLAPFGHDQGHSQVSSFGFGGSNGHGIFWGRRPDGVTDPAALMARKLRRHAVPEVRVLGSDPDDWDSDWPDLGEPGAFWSLEFHEGDDADAPLRWVRTDEPVEQDDSSVADADEPGFEIVGNFSSWEGQAMEVGQAPGLHTACVVVPDEAALEFRFLKDGDEDQVLAPEEPQCARKSCAVAGPAKGLTNTWRVPGAPGTEVEVRLLVSGCRKSVMWLKRG